MSKAVTVGMPILYFPAGTAVALQGAIAGIEADGRVNIAYTDSQGQPRSRQGVPFNDKPNPGGDYVVSNVGGDATAATEAHQRAMKAGFQGVPTTGNVAKGSAESPPPAAGDFSSAALSSDNVQAAGSGGPFDPANTAKAHMTQHQTLESQSVGRPTTGGVTPKISRENAHLLSERDREVLDQMEHAKSPDEKVRLANAGSGVVTPGSARLVRDSQKDDRADPLSPRPGTPEAEPVNANVVVGFSAQPNAEVDRIEREERLHDEALEKSKQITADRKKDKLATAGATEVRAAAKKSYDQAVKDESDRKSKATAKVAAKTPTQKHKPAAKAAKKPAAKKVAAKKSR